jgi:hypothetical protein
MTLFLYFVALCLSAASFALPACDTAVNRQIVLSDASRPFLRPFSNNRLERCVPRTSSPSTIVSFSALNRVSDQFSIERTLHDTSNIEEESFALG